MSFQASRKWKTVGGWGPLVRLAMAVLLSISGCRGAKDPYARVPISGTVKLDGELLTKGYLIFEPKSGQPTQSGGMIQNGKFDVRREAGPVPGKYSVAIFSGADDPRGGAAPGTPESEIALKKARGERVPKKFNINTTLIREVKSDEENVFDFDLTSK
jgi:hypothetical protein